jgi:RNA polymerase sigma-70 factor (ECF subfamily)
MKSESAVEALRRAADEPEAFANFYDEHDIRMLSYFARRVYDPDIAMDLTAETFAQAYVGRHRFRGISDGEAAGWLYAIARRQLGRYFKKARVELRALERLGLEPPALDDDERARIEELAALDDLRGALRSELATLSAARREALELRIVEELPYAEVASRLGISEQTARARVSRGLRTLAVALDGNPRVKETPA